MEINVTRFMHNLGDVYHNQANLGSEACNTAWNEALEATKDIEPITDEEALAIREMFIRYGCEDVLHDKHFLMAMLRQELRLLKLEHLPKDHPSYDGGNALYKTDDNQWYLCTI